MPKVNTPMAPIYAINQAVFNVRDDQTAGDGVTDDTAAILRTWAKVKAAGGCLFFEEGNYLVPDGLVLQSASNFSIRADRGATLWIGPNTTANPGRATHDVLIIADCTDFSVDGLTFDARKDTLAGNQFLTANAASGQKNITVQDGTKYVVGQGVSVFGGATANSGNEKNLSDTNTLIDSINGNILTLHSNLNNSYTGTGASGGAYVTQWQTGGTVAYSAAGRSLSSEDAQNGLHLLNCKRFSIRNCVAQNTWESPIKMGTGFQTSTPTDGCAYGIVSGNMAKHGYDQGISVWNSQYITVSANKCEDAGWGGIVFTGSNDCTAVGNVCVNNLFSIPGDLFEGSGIAVEGGIRVVVEGNICTGNNLDGIHLGTSAIGRGNLGTVTLPSGALGAATSITVSNGANMTVGFSYTLVDAVNLQLRENIVVQNISVNTVTLTKGLRNAYSNSSTVNARYCEDVIIAGNSCSQNFYGSGITAGNAINLRILGNECMENGLAQPSDTFANFGINILNATHGAIVQNNTIRNNYDDGIIVQNCNGVVVESNDIANSGLVSSNPSSPTTIKHGIKLQGMVDGLVAKNKSFFNTGDGIAFEANAGTQTHHVQVIGNICHYNHWSGIRADGGGWGVGFTANEIAYNSDSGMKILGYKDSLFASNQCFNQAGQEGIRFDDSGANFCTDNKVLGNLLYDDQGSPTQSWGFRELNNSARSIIRDNRCYGNTNAAQISKAATSTPCNITAPSVPSSTVAYTNTTTYDCTVIITGGTVTAITVGGVATGLTATPATVRVPVNQTIAITYSVAPSWKWYAE